MAKIIVKQPNGKYAEYSTIVDHFTMTDATRIEIIEERALSKTWDAILSIHEICDYYEKYGRHKYSGKKLNIP